MNVQYYTTAFDQAMWHLVHKLGYKAEWQTERKQGWADVRHEVSFTKELRVGSLYIIESSVSAVGVRSLTALHRLLTMENQIAATSQIKSVYFDLDTRRALELPNALRHAASAALADESNF